MTFLELSILKSVENPEKLLKPCTSNQKQKTLNIKLVPTALFLEL